ncbi:transglycosylase, putative [Parvularcula bermudensis HTCC2503]|uniref:Transglycosylase, putative n=1 Tax=Parvularcula bermudensis (strain ATCC BAA-594 / HTCC2503 / KCTC 12087) TaxID=314260 RepID=E0TBI8_PARBH|nr:lytic transglycosylase domain-containing protein [Parvularcula bermudensis]ADM08363.1 transglycosylase, putative [Parvularcula bermudensis HTCC2503]
MLAGIAIGLSCGLSGALSAAAAPHTPLSNADAARYEKIFALQADAKWTEADRLIAALDNDILLGYVLEQRYFHPTAYRSSYPELKRWLSAYADHPTADRVYDLAMKRRTGAPPRRPQARPWRSRAQVPLPPALLTDYRETPIDRGRVDTIERHLRALCRQGKPAEALNYLMAPAQFNDLTATQTDRVRGWIAAAFYYDGQLTRAAQVAQQATQRSGDDAILSHWILGLIHMRRDDPATAFGHFAAQARSPYQEDSLRAAAAFWAARSALRSGYTGQVTDHLSLGAAYPFTFYGQLSLAMLGLESGIDWSIPPLTQRQFDQLVAKNRRVERAAALAQVGRRDEAETELKWAQGELSAADDLALLSLAQAARLPNAQLLIAHQAAAETPANAHLRGGLFPAPPFAPSNGFEVDRAVLFGLIRQESKFLPHASSRVGARGLMQLMPRTASYVADKANLSAVHASERLLDPGYNMQLGQSYVRDLLETYHGGTGDLIGMALSYNWGPGNYARWKTATGIDDPLLMIESVPNDEARHFVETVLTNFWLYRDRFGEAAPSRDSLAAGGDAVYVSVAQAGR